MDRTHLMTDSQISEALARLAPDAIAVLEKTLSTAGKVDRTRVDTAWKVLREARAAAPSVGSEEVAQLANVLELVSGD